MSTFQKFIQYYKPYKKVFIFDLICAAFISLVDLAYPQILRSLTKTLFLKDASMILKTLPIIGGILFICYIFQAFCNIMSAVRDISWELRWNVICAVNCLTIMKIFLFPIMISITPDRWWAVLFLICLIFPKLPITALRIYLSLL